METVTPENETLVIGIQEKLTDSLKRFRQYIKKMKDILNINKIEKDKGFSFLQCKYEIILQYTSNQLYYFLLRLHGKELTSTNVVQRLIHMRLLIEKIKPLEKQFKHQIERLVSLKPYINSIDSNSDTNTTVPEQNELLYKPNLQGMIEDIQKTDKQKLEKKSSNILQNSSDVLLLGDSIEKTISTIQYELQADQPSSSTNERKQNTPALIKELQFQYSDEPEIITSTGMLYIYLYMNCFFFL